MTGRGRGLLVWALGLVACGGEGQQRGDFISSLHHTWQRRGDTTQIDIYGCDSVGCSASICGDQQESHGTVEPVAPERGQYYLNTKDPDSSTIYRFPLWLDGTELWLGPPGGYEWSHYDTPYDVVAEYSCGGSGGGGGGSDAVGACWRRSLFQYTGMECGMTAGGCNGDHFPGKDCSQVDCNYERVCVVGGKAPNSVGACARYTPNGTKCHRVPGSSDCPTNGNGNYFFLGRECSSVVCTSDHTCSVR